MMENGVRVVITTQVPHEGSNLSVYRVGHIIKEKIPRPSRPRA